ncbi:MAG: hypothetical protein MRJ66_20065 [Nitrospira sp.]|nr:hypothetical protein [Nitrospira sp.]
MQLNQASWSFSLGQEYPGSSIALHGMILPIEFFNNSPRTASITMTSTKSEVFLILKKRLSLALIIAEKTKIKIDYSTIFKVPLEKDNVYSYLNSFDSSFVTTNYDKYLCPDSRKVAPKALGDGTSASNCLE